MVIVGIEQCTVLGASLFKGQMKIIYDGKEEIAKAGDAYYYPPNHTAMAEAGTEVWEFSPNDKLQKTIEVINRNMEAIMSKK